jgi:hypothetical protein
MKLIVLATILILAVYMLSLSIEPELHTVEKVINDQVEQIYNLHPAE